MRALLTYLFLAVGLSVSAQPTKTNPANMLKAPVANDRVMVSNNGAWVDQPLSYVQNWLTSGNDVVRSGSNATLVIPTNGTFGGWQIGLAASAIYFADIANLSTGEYRHVAGVAGWGGYHSWHTDGAWRMGLDATGSLAVSGNISNAGNAAFGGAISGNKLDVYGTINAGAAGATAGNVLLKSRYDAWPAQALITQYSSGSIGLAAYMYQDGSAQWRSSFAYGAISKCALLLGYDGFVLWAAPTENVAPGQVLTTQPTQVYGVSNLGIMMLSGRAIIGSTSDNGTDRLQITGTARISSALKLGTNVASIQTGNGNASLYLWDRGTLQVPTTYTSDPSTAANGELWQNLSGGEQNLKYRANDVNSRVALVERDLIGTEVLVSFSTYAITGASTIRFDALSNNITSTVGAGMDERFDYVVRCTRNDVNSITLTADSGYFFAIDGLAALTPTNYICLPFEIFTMRRRGSVIYINQ
jgi:hypothetical protein